MTDSPEWQTLNYSFPQKGYILYVRIREKNTNRPIYNPLNKLVMSPKEVNLKFPELKKSLYAKNPRLTIDPLLVLLKLHLIHKIPLNKHMWGEHAYNYPNSQRMIDLNRCLTKPSLYKILVTPQNTLEHEELFEIAMPVLATTTTESLTKVFSQLNINVDPRATHAALYQPTQQYGYIIGNNKLISSK